MNKRYIDTYEILYSIPLEMDFHFTVILHFRYCVLQNLDNHETSFKLLYRLKLVKAVATAPEKTPTEKVKFIELRDHHQSIPRQILA